MTRPPANKPAIATRTCIFLPPLFRAAGEPQPLLSQCASLNSNRTGSRICQSQSRVVASSTLGGGRGRVRQLFMLRRVLFERLLDHVVQLAFDLGRIALFLAGNGAPDQ